MQYTNQTEAVVKKILKQKAQALQQQTHVHDICIRQVKLSKNPEFYQKTSTHLYGEFEKNTQSKKTPAPDRCARIIEQIKLFLALGHNYKQTLNTPNDHVIRILLPEFYFYTAENPLSEQEFKYIISEIEKMAGWEETPLTEDFEKNIEGYFNGRDRYANIHLLLSSFPLHHQTQVQKFSSNGQPLESAYVSEVMNTALYVQCGNQPTINTFTKQAISSVDCQYPNLSHYLFDQANKDINPVILGTTSATPFNINHNGVIRCKTSGGQIFNEVIEICYEHKEAKAKINYEKETQRCINNTEMQPLVCSHLFTSNSAPSLDCKHFTPSITHIDPYHPYHRDLYPISSEQELLQLVENLPPQKIPLTFVYENDAVIIENPPFGGPIRIELMPQQTLQPATASEESILSNHQTIIEHTKPDFFNMTHPETPHDGQQSDAMRESLDFKPNIVSGAANPVQSNNNDRATNFTHTKKYLFYPYHIANLARADDYSDDDEEDDENGEDFDMDSDCIEGADHDDETMSATFAGQASNNELMFEPRVEVNIIQNNAHANMLSHLTMPTFGAANFFRVGSLPNLDSSLQNPQTRLDN